MKENKFNEYLKEYNREKVLLHSCCAPCSCAIVEDLLRNDINITIFFYNPNIHPVDEYNKRKKEIERLAEKNNIPFIDADYDTDYWFERVKGFENEPEKGKRCSLCFDIRFEKTAEYAHENGFKIFTSSLTMSSQKIPEQIFESALKASSKYPDLKFWDVVWRKDGRKQRERELIQKEKYFQQTYCGCIYSINDN